MFSCEICEIFKDTFFTEDLWATASEIRAGEMDFKVQGPWNTEKYCQPPWLADKKNFRILDALEWLKQ